MRYVPSILPFQFMLLWTLWGCGDSQEGEEEGSKLDQYCAPADPSKTDAVVVEIPSGVNSRSVGKVLQTAQVVSSSDNFSTCVQMTGAGDCMLKVGRFELSPAMNVDQIVEVLCGDPMIERGVPLTITPGWRVVEIDQELAKQGLISPGEYQQLVTEPEGFEAPFPLPSDTLEGYLYPETYDVDPDKWDTRQFIQRQLDTFTARFYEVHQTEIEAAKAKGRTLEQLVIMASMIEREEPTVANRTLVAGIIWKRLDKGWKLGIDATSRYTLAQWNDRQAFLKKLRDPNDPYNTRMRSGMPPTAIGNPTLSALEAALQPVDSEYWYYLHDADGVLHPSKSNSEHEATRRKYNVY